MPEVMEAAHDASALLRGFPCLLPVADRSCGIDRVGDATRKPEVIISPGATVFREREDEVNRFSFGELFSPKF